MTTYANSDVPTCVSDGASVINNKELNSFEAECVYRYIENEYRKMDVEYFIEENWDEEAPEYIICMDHMQEIVNEYDRIWDANLDHNSMIDAAVREVLEKYMRE